MTAEPAPRRSGPPRWLEAAVLLLVSLGAVSSALLTQGHIIGDGVDLYGTFWFYWWMGEVLTEGQSAGFTDVMFHPLGKDIFAHTGSNYLDALASWPFQKVFGFPRYQPWFVAVLLGLNALCFRPLAREVLGARDPGAPVGRRGLSWAAFVATVLWTTNPYTLFELMTGRLTQAVLWFLPLGVVWFLRIGRDPAWRGLRAPLLAGLFTALQAWTYWFMGFFMAFGFAWLALVALVRGATPRGRLVAGWAVSAAACLAAVGPGLWMMVGASGDGAVPGLSDAAAPLWEAVWQKPPPLGNNVEATLHGAYLMETRGQPMLGHLTWGGGLLLFALFGRQRWRWLGLAVVLGVLSLGAVLPLGPGRDIVLPHYMLLYHVLPFFDRLWFPYRMLVMVFLALSLGIGTVVARATRGPARRAPWALAMGLLALNLAEQHRHLAWPLLHRDLSPPPVYTWIGDQGGALIELPIGLARISIAWQAVHEQPTFGGMAENASIFWPEGYRRRLQNTFIRALRKVTRDPSEPLSFNDNERRALQAEGFRWVVLDRHLMDSDLHRWAYGGRGEGDREGAPFLAQQRIIDALGPPVAVDGALVVWDLSGAGEAPPALQPTEAGLTTRSWPTDDMPAYEAHLRELGRIP